MSKTILLITNQHSFDCGLPPELSEEGAMLSYFQNQYGEQWFFRAEWHSEKAYVTSGEVDWETLEISWEKPFPNCILNTPEQFWLQSCLYSYFCSQGRSISDINKRLAQAYLDEYSDLKSFVHELIKEKAH